MEYALFIISSKVSVLMEGEKNQSIAVKGEG